MGDLVFSFVVPTINRVSELERLLESITKQGLQSHEFEVIIVDQNSDERLKSILERFRDFLPLKVIRSNICGSSFARNIGLRAAQGKYLTFPDDDSYYPDGLVSKLISTFEASVDKTIWVIRCFDPSENRNHLRYPDQIEIISRVDDPRAFLAPQISQFFRTEDLKAIGGFDENFGIGSRFGSGEDTDLVLRFLKGGWTMKFLPAYEVYHRYSPPTEITMPRGRLYAIGFGALCKKHRLFVYGIWRSIKAILGGILLLFLLKPTIAYKCFLVGIFRLYGFLIFSQSRQTA